MGRPSKYSEKLVEAICARLSEGEPLASICRDDGMPGVSTVWQWQKDKPEVSESIARAREIGFDALAAECLDIADETSRDTIKDEETGSERPNSEWITRSRLRVETRLKLLAKWDPKRYGELLKLAGADGEGPVPLATLTAEMTPAQAAEAYTKLIG